MARPDNAEPGRRMPVGSPGSEGPANAIVISYRRDDSAGSAGRLYDNLCLHFGKSKVFMDVDAIPVGAEFVEYIVGIISNSDVLLTAIGPHWQELNNESGVRKLDDEKDVVRLEIQTALAKQVQIVPILVDAARMPRADAQG
jgi:TIR domain-containing protein